MAGLIVPDVNLFPLTNYSFGIKDPQYERDPSVPTRMQRLKDEFEQYGSRRTVEAVLLVHEHNHPHLLLLQLGTTFFKLPGGELDIGEDEITGCQRWLTKTLAVEGTSIPWNVCEIVCNWYRPSYDQNQYPYIPGHVTRPKEHRRVFVVELPPNAALAVPKNYKLVAAPLFELHDNPQTYGPVIAQLPAMLSRINFVYN
ncbi:cleavage and polyadenylation specific factor 5 [Capsaspora owczarzaki ATCC 30864]|uniref:Cleavage and polyadenylation specificity factor subunit 5 n=1 Tax=Capsaspora owczarzaki (strain ATCC 30864) TaxID=595528 RepID=A0A0D2WJ88_CAPO3|nr:cleavage and polyadenylation specific factor 5 [Capsaspora owczarzaki ATCC 30864]KJE90060.1 cleavage and polyadenylation specific factor 5 [Capsaspora owczarzaki ATCC 30864]|eukprot:XP_004349955.1 cleavage and polyadenylation specific factor 5 [Capsaspora owczarzaki ATCC 30864]